MSYTAEDIKTLSFRDGVRTRIQMYLGSADNEGAYQAIKEIVNNATDEALCGYGSKIKIGLSEKTNEVVVKDFGRGVPFLVKEDGTNVLVDIYTKAHTGGKFDDSSYKNTSGLNGVGGSCVCLSSKIFVVSSYRDGKCATAQFEEGNLVDYKEEPYSGAATGTYVRFIPDPAVFKDEKIQYSFKRLCQDIKSISYLYNGVEFVLQNYDTGEVERYCAKNGIVDFVKDNLPDPVHPHIISFAAEDGKDKMEIAFQWGSERETSYVFVNGLRCPEGGSPITGARTAITKTLNALNESSFDGDVIRRNLFYVINCSVASPSFSNQTKSKINNPSLRTLASNCFSEAIKLMKQKYEKEFETVCAMLTRIAKAESAAQRAREAANKIASGGKSLNTLRDLPSKLADCNQLGGELWLTEGDSASGSAKSARDPHYQAIMPLRGKVLNTCSKDLADMLKNKEIRDIATALGTGIGEKFNLNNLRYDKVVIFADSDEDGSHISLLLCTLFLYHFPEIVKAGHLYRSIAPFYRITKGKDTLYFYSTEELNEYKKKNAVSHITRYKGLGEMGSDELWRTTMDPQHRRLEQLTISDLEKTISLFDTLMGKDAQLRRDFIGENVKKDEGEEDGD